MLTVVGRPTKVAYSRLEFGHGEKAIEGWSW